MARRRKGRAIHGWLVLDKPEGISSNAALVQARRILDAQKAGHAGTLDPLASGVLPIAFGEATKTIAYLMAAQKTYEFSIRWGVSTDTLDREGAAVQRSDLRASLSDIDTALAGFLGEQLQVPPLYCAIRVQGQRACDRIRRGETLDELAPRPVHLFEARRLETDSAPDETHFHIRCGKGYYVRSLARDLAETLGVCGHVGSLRRLSVGPFSQKDGKRLDKLARTCHKQDSDPSLLPMIRGLSGMPVCVVSPFEADRLRKGQSIALPPKLDVAKSEALETDHCVVLEGETLVALARKDVQALRPIRVFNF